MNIIPYEMKGENRILYPPEKIAEYIKPYLPLKLMFGITRDDIKYFNDEMKKELNKYLIPDLTNIVQGYYKNDIKLTYYLNIFPIHSMINYFEFNRFSYTCSYNNKYINLDVHQDHSVNAIFIDTDYCRNRGYKYKIEEMLRRKTFRMDKNHKEHKNNPENGLNKFMYCYEDVSGGLKRETYDDTILIQKIRYMIYRRRTKIRKIHNYSSSVILYDSKISDSGVILTDLFDVIEPNFNTLSRKLKNLDNNYELEKGDLEFLES